MRAEVHTNSTLQETERVSTESVELTTAAIMTEWLVASIWQQLQNTERVLEKAAKVAEVSLQLCRIAVANAMRNDGSSPLRARDMKAHLENMEDVQRQYPLIGRLRELECKLKPMIREHRKHFRDSKLCQWQRSACRTAGKPIQSSTFQLITTTFHSWPGLRHLH